MKRHAYLMIPVLLASALSLQAQRRFEIKGKLDMPSQEGEKVTLSYIDGSKYITDSSFLKDGVFSFKGVVSEPIKATVTIRMKTVIDPSALLAPPPNRAELYIDGGTITLEGAGMSVAHISGGRSQEEFVKLKNIVKPIRDAQQQALNGIRKAREANDTAGISRARALFDRLKASEDSAELAFIKAHPASFVALSMLKDRANPRNLSENRQGILAMYERFSPQLKESVAGKEIAQRLEVTGRIAAGTFAPDFTMNDTLGRPVSLSSFRGKYVLLDFWASWCMPCRFENPAVVKAYNAFKDRNFTILSVSLDRPGAQQAWLDAIHKDGLQWTHVSDLTFWESPVVKLYGIQSIPMNYLIGPDGKIVATYLRGEALEKKLGEVLH